MVGSRGFLQIKIYVSGLNLQTSNLHITDGDLNELNVTWKKKYFRGFIFWAREIRLQYFGYSPNLLQILKLSINGFLSAFLKNRKLALSELVCTHEGTINFQDLIVYPIHVSHSQTGLPFWISRNAIISGVSSCVYGPEIEWDRARFPEKFAGFVWGIEDGKPHLRKILGQEQIARSSKLSLIKDLQFDNLATDGLENYKIIDDCIVINGLLVLKENTLHYLDNYNRLEEISWPTNFASNLSGGLNLIEGSFMSSEVIREAVLYGSSTSWYHFLVDILPPLLKLRTSDNSKKAIIVRRELPLNILKIINYLGFKEVIVMKDGTMLRVDKLEMRTDLRTGSVIDVDSRSHDMFKVRSFLSSLASATPKSPYLFIERDPALFRPLHNSAELKLRLQDLGFEIVRPESVDLIKQIELFKNAHIVVAESGAGLTNIIMMQSGSYVVEISGGNNNLLWRKISEMFNVNHTLIFGKSRFLSNILTGNGAFKVNLKRTVLIIEGILSESRKKNSLDL